ncbi:hypothetical protein BD770DRAFT_213819 [Pilaira anomala]|nr:hypothetical protein BD770DRAFT_213819 [Pilaira anomala]
MLAVEYTSLLSSIYILFVVFVNSSIFYHFSRYRQLVTFQNLQCLLYQFATSYFFCGFTNSQFTLYFHTINYIFNFGQEVCLGTILPLFALL